MKQIHLSLKHINFDAKGNRRSNFTIEQAITIFTTALNGIFLEEDGTKQNISFYVYYFETENKKKYKSVFYTENKQIHIRLITLYRSRHL